MGCKNKLLCLDQFGALFQFSISGEEPQYRSVAGAIASLFIYLTSFLYFLYLLMLWLTDQVPPTVNSQNKFLSEGKTFRINESPFYLTVETYDNDTLKAYKGRKLYDVKTQLFVKEEVIENQNYHPNCESKFSRYMMDFYDPICTDIFDQNQSELTQNFQNRLQDAYLGYYFYPCDLKNDQTCLNDSEVEAFLGSLDGDGRLTTITQEFDYSTKEIKSMPFDYYFPVKYRQLTVLNLYLTVSHLTVERGVIFPTRETVEFVSKVQIMPQTVYREIEDPYLVVWVSLDRIQVNIEIVYPKLPEILAQLQTVFSWLMIFGLFFSAINNRMLRKRLLNQIGKIYFTNYTELATSIKLCNSKEIFDHNQKLKQRIDDQLSTKYNFLTILYEISRIQVALQTLIKRKELSDIQQLKYSILDESEQNDREMSKVLTQQDFFILGLQKTQKSQYLRTKGRIKSKPNQICDLHQEDNNQLTFISQKPQQLDTSKKTQSEEIIKLSPISSPLTIERIE